jgi:hypothetical protein
LIRVAGNDEVGFIIKAALALAAKTESVLAPFHREGRNFITSSVVVFFVVTGENALCGLGPVVRSSSSSRHLFVRVCLVGAVIRRISEKAFQFYSNEVEFTSIMENEDGGHMSNGGGHMSNNAETDCMLCLFVSMVGLFGFAAFFVVIAVFATPLVGVSFAFIHFGEKSSNAQGRTRISVVC